MAEYQTAYNPSDAPIAVTRSGRQIGGRSWGAVNVDDPVTKALLGDGALVVAQEPDDLDADGLNPDAVAAFRQTADARASGAIGDLEAEPELDAGDGDQGAAQPAAEATAGARRTGSRNRPTTSASPSSSTTEE